MTLKTLRVDHGIVNKDWPLETLCGCGGGSKPFPSHLDRITIKLKDSVRCHSGGRSGGRRGTYGRLIHVLHGLHTKIDVAMAALSNEPSLVDDTLRRIDSLISALEPHAGEAKSEAKNASGGGGNANASKQGAGKKKGGQGGKKQPAAGQKGEKKKGGRGAAPAPSDPIELFKLAKLQVSKLGTVSMVPGSEKLFMTDVDIGGGVSKKLVTGLAKHYKAEDLSGRKVITIVNLKAAKLAGQLSEVMLLAGDHTPPGGDMQIKILGVPEGSEIGDVVVLDGEEAPPDFDPIEMNKKRWDKIWPGFKTSGGLATYHEKKLVTSKGEIKCELPDGCGIH